jgi:hypothetical protein
MIRRGAYPHLDDETQEKDVTGRRLASPFSGIAYYFTVFYPASCRVLPRLLECWSGNALA